MVRLPDMFLTGAEDAGGRFLLPTTGFCLQQGPVFIIVVVPGPYAPKPCNSSGPHPLYRLNVGRGIPKVHPADVTFEPRLI
jgi:hypothetical protein